MADWIETSLSIFRDKTIHISYRISLFVISVVLLLAVNEYAGFSRNYSINRKLDQIKALKDIDSNVLKKDTAVIRKFNQLKLDIVYEQNYLDKLRSKFTILLYSSDKPKGRSHVEVVKNADYVRQYDRWYYISAMSLAFLSMVVFFFFGIGYALFSSKESYREKVTTVVGIIILMPVFYAYGLLFKWCIEFVPIIEHYVWVNYIINVVAQITIIYLISVLRKKYLKSKVV